MKVFLKEISVLTYLVHITNSLCHQHYERFLDACNPVKYLMNNSHFILFYANYFLYFGVYKSFNFIKCIKYYWLLYCDTSEVLPVFKGPKMIIKMSENLDLIHWIGIENNFLFYLALSVQIVYFTTFILS